GRFATACRSSNGRSALARGSRRGGSRSRLSMSALRAPARRRGGRSSMPARNGPTGSPCSRRRDMAEGGTAVHNDNHRDKRQEKRRRAMAAFLVAQGWSENAPSVLAGDASFRGYYRLLDGHRRAVLMDAPPPQEDVGPYVTVAGILHAYGFSAPEIYAEDRAN